MERNWFGEEVVPQMRMILTSFDGDAVPGFRELARRGWFDNAIEDWHNAPEDAPVAQLELHTALGLSWAEYVAVFSTYPDAAAG